MRPKSSKIIAGISSILLILSFVVLGIFYSMVAKQKVAYVNSTKERIEAEARKTSLETLVKTLDETKEERALLMSRILRDEQVVDFLSLIETLGREQGAALKTNSLNSVSLNDTFESLVISITVEGSYDAVMQVLKLFEHLPYQVVISSVRIENEDGVGVLSWKGSFEMSVTKFKKI